MDILGIGNVLLDIFCFSEEDTALSLGLHPNSSVRVSPERLDELLLAITNPVYVSGGAVSNSLKTASALGFTCGAIGCIGQEDRENDRWARIITADLAAYGVQQILEERNVTTGRRLILHMPGGVTSIAWAPGAAPTLRPEQIEADLVARTSMVYLDGHLLKNTAITDRIITLCKGFSVPLVIDIGTVETASKRSSSIPEFLTRTDCVLLVNEDEAFPLAVTLESIVPGDRGMQSASSFVDSIFSFFTTKKQAFPCIVRKEGPGGATAWHRGTRIHRDTQEVAHCIDKTAAGDVFGGAFMCAFLKNAPLSDALDFANTAARHALFVPGSRLDWNDFVALRDELPLS
ncbi:MAG TPA: hypothetical protein GXZ47_03365 [Treponema sp.]|nr:hypothetical protein [Treponema sp.]